jgi:AraC-like DNA-binding protein
MTDDYDERRFRVDAHGDDLDEALDVLAHAYEGIEWHAENSDAPFSYRYTSAGDQFMSLRAVRFEGRIEGEMPPGDDLVMQWITRGQGTLDVGPDEVRMEAGQPRLWPSVPFRFAFSDYDQRLVQISRSTVDGLAAERGFTPAQLRFDHTVEPRQEAMALWRNSVTLISRSVLDGEASPLLQAEMGRLGAIALMELYPQQGSPLPDELLLPRNAHVRAAIEHVHAHVQLPLTSVDLAEVAHVSVRALQQAFQKHVGTTPNGYIRALRLDRIREELLVSDPHGASVAEVAKRWGFAHAGRFAAAYAEKFGEYPSETLERAR